MSDPYNPYALMSSSIAFWADSTRALQTQYVNACSHMIKKASQNSSGTQAEQGFPKMQFEGSEAYLQDLFQTAANINLSAWTHTANMLAAMPNWMQWPTQASGQVFNDVFGYFADYEKS